MFSNRRSLPFVALVGCGAMFLAACGSGSTATVSSGSSKATSSSANVSSALKAAEARVTAFTAHSSPLGITQTVPVPSKHLIISYTQCPQAVCTQISSGIAEAAKAIGATYLPFTHQDTPQTVSAAFQSAISAHANIVLTSGDPVQWYQPELSTLNAAHVPVVGWSLSGGIQPQGLAANLVNGDDYYFLGVLMADWVTVKTHQTGNAVLVNVPAYPVLQTMAQGFATEYHAACPNCKYTTVNLTVSEIVSGASTAAVLAAVQQDPSVNYIVATNGGWISAQLATAINSAGFTNVKAISAQGTQANDALIQSGQMQVADVALPTQLLAWRAVDVGLRALAGQSIGTCPRPAVANIAGYPDIQKGCVPEEFVTASTLQTLGNNIWTPTPNFQSEFLKLWGKG